MEMSTAICYQCIINKRSMHLLAFVRTSEIGIGRAFYQSSRYPRNPILPVPHLPGRGLHPSARQGRIACESLATSVFILSSRHTAFRVSEVSFDSGQVIGDV
jgi:hypothetical protein